MAFAHEAVLDMGPDADLAAPGAAVTVALCGRWEHEPPCPIAPHHSRAERVTGGVRLRTLFAIEPEREDAVRRRIDAGVGAGELRGPDGVHTRWGVYRTRPTDVLPEEAELAENLRTG